MDKIQAKRPPAPYFVLIDGEEHGPFTRNDIQGQLLKGEITRETLFARDGARSWERLETILPEIVPAGMMHVIDPLGNHPPVLPPPVVAIQCPACLETVPSAAAKCRHCGTRLRASYVPEVNAPGLFAIASLLITGLGQMLLGQVGKGLLLLGLAIACGAMTFGISLLIIMPIAVIDAYRVAVAIRNGRRVRPWEWFPAG